MNRFYDKKHHIFAVLLNANSYFKYTKTSLDKNGHAADFFQILILSMTVLILTGSEYEHIRSINTHRICWSACYLSVHNKLHIDSLKKLCTSNYILHLCFFQLDTSYTSYLMTKNCWFHFI